MNQLEVSLQQTITALAARDWSRRRIARELGINRETVGKYLRLNASSGGSNPAIPPLGSQPVESSKPAILPAGSGGTDESKPAIVPAGGAAGRRSQCEPWRQRIEAAVIQQGLSAQRIYQDLVLEEQFTGSYDAVKRFVRQWQNGELPFRRMEVAAGFELQVDFGQGAWVIDADGRKRRPHLLRLVLSHSRKAYSEVFWRQTTENFIRGVENTFRTFGGVTPTVIIDNLKAAVVRADWFDPEISPKVREFCEHYGTVILPTKPATPRHKGKIEAAVKYAQNNALKGRSFESLNAQNLFLAEWERTVADTRIHGTTRQQVGKVFAECERPALLPLPATIFPMFDEAQRTVHRDGHVELQKAYYSVPPEYMGRTVWVRWETRLVRIYNRRMEQIALHAHHEPGQFSTLDAHIHDHKRRIIERGVDYVLDRARLIGPQTGSWAEAMYRQRGVEGIRVLQGLLQLAEKHPVADLERAAAVALHHGCWRLRELRELLVRTTAPIQTTFLETHPLIRNLEAYTPLLPACFETNDTQNV